MLAISKIFWKEAIAYRAQYMLSVLLTPLRFIVMIMIWSAVYGFSSAETISGYSFESLITYFIVATFGFMFIFDDTARNTEELVRSGNFLVNLLRPIHYLYYAFIQKIARRSFAISVEVIPLIAIMVIFFRNFLVLGDIIGYILSMSLAFVLAYLIYFGIGLLAFWIIDIRSLVWLIDFFIRFTSGIMIPIDLFPPAIHTILKFLPFQYLMFIPTKIYLGEFSYSLTAAFTDTIYYQFMIQLLWIVVLFFIIQFSWNRAMKRFCGEGA